MADNAGGVRAPVGCSGPPGFSGARSHSTDLADAAGAGVNVCAKLGILRAEDFYAMVLKMGSEKTKVMAVRLRRGEEHLRTFGIPDNLISAAPKHLLIAPKLRGDLARLRRVNASRLAVELRDLHQHLNGMPEPDVSELNSASPRGKVLFRVSKDGARTATLKGNPQTNAGVTISVAVRRPLEMPSAFNRLSIASVLRHAEHLRAIPLSPLH